jgi:xanthine dehydrogenase accessory factor
MIKIDNYGGDSLKIFSTLNSSLLAGKPTALITVIASSNRQDLIGKKALYTNLELVKAEFEADLSAEISAGVLPIIGNFKSELLNFKTTKGEELKLFVHSFVPQPRLIILGGGHVGAALCRMAAHLDYNIVLIDDRPAFASLSSHPDAHQLICDRFETALEKLEPSPADYIVIVTRGHKHDRLCLEQSLKRKQFAYIGMIGSRKKVQAQMQKLAASGFSQAELDRVYSPIGLPIGAITEPEIAISILAEITAVRRKNGKAETARTEVLNEIERLAIAGEQAVLVTIIATMGSTPRKTGSQMIVYPDGSLKGTIGGGCVEADARREALLQLDAGRPALFRQRLIADAAAEEGMACGGIMDLFLEPLLPE